jgi:Protein of unknown function (DUF3306)
MSERFLSRWSRRKRAAVAAPPATREPGADSDAGSIPPAPLGGEGGEDRRSEPGGGDFPRSELAEAPLRAGAGEHPPPAFDQASLPAIDQIEAGSDVSAFLRPGVPADLARAALRRAWVADPAIRDFIGPSENAWDFTAPGGVPGFGPLRPIDEAWRLAAQLTGATPAAAAETASAETPRGEDAAPASDAAQQSPSPAAPTGAGPLPPAPDAAMQQDAPIAPRDISSLRRRHGGALAE